MALMELAAEMVAHREQPVTVDGETWRLRIDGDCDTSINDFDCYGKIETVRSYDGRSTRPAAFDGKARILDRTWGWHTWWQPPSDLTTDQIDEQFKFVEMIYREGFYLLIVEHINGTDAYGEPIVVDYTTLGAIDPDHDDSDLVEYVVDMIYQLRANA